MVCRWCRRNREREPAGSSFSTEGINAAAIKIQPIGGGGGSSGAADGFYVSRRRGRLRWRRRGRVRRSMEQRFPRRARPSAFPTQSIGAGGGDAYSPKAGLCIWPGRRRRRNGSTVTFTSKNKGVSVTTEGIMRTRRARFSPSARRRQGRQFFLE
ncbi:MAG: hypothetical protein HPM95_15255 [Alphaproteobacteria bacterium]|nr:hypothetical protein [Alphaproteobacteria bacterium]